MAYGQNLSSGLQDYKSSASASWNAQLETASIQSGYAFNIFIGDPVYVQGGFLRSLFDGANPSATTPILGVFKGWAGTVPTSNNPIDPSSPGKTYWAANTVTLNGADAKGFYLQDPNNYYNIQSDATGVRADQVGKTATLSFTALNPGNPNTGDSTVVLNGGSIGVDPTHNVRIMGFIDYPGNVPGVPYNNVKVLIQNHTLMQRAPGL